MIEIILEILVLVAALSMDAFAASFAYGMSRIRIPVISVFILTITSSLILAAALLAGSFLGGLLPESLTNEICFLILFMLGFTRLFQKHCDCQAKKANKNHDDLLSPLEALPLGIALSIDSLAAGIGAGIMPIYVPGTLAASFLMGIAAILGGWMLGRLMSGHFPSSLCRLGGALLIVLAFLKLF